MFSLGKQFLSHVLPGVVKPIRVLWNEVIGFIFLCFAAVALYRAWTEFGRIAQDPNSSGRVVLSLIFGLVMLFFGLTSFLRAKKISRS